jgi:hypothetical protein
MHAWLDDEAVLWLQQQGQAAVRCRDLSKTQLVTICEELDIYPAVSRDLPRYSLMHTEILNYYDLSAEDLREMDEDILEFYYEWARYARKDVCRALYDHFCAANIIDPHCAVDRERRERRLLPLIRTSSPTLVLSKQKYQPLRLPRRTW